RPTVTHRVDRLARTQLKDDGGILEVKVRTVARAHGQPRIVQGVEVLLTLHAKCVGCCVEDVDRVQEGDTRRPAWVRDRRLPAGDHVQAYCRLAGFDVH